LAQLLSAILQPAEIRIMKTKVLSIAIFIASYGVHLAAGAQKTPEPANASPAAVTTACPTAQTMKPVQMYGLWKVAFVNPPVGLPAAATMRLEQHAEFSESLAGIVSRELWAASAAGHAAKAFLAGDLEDGVLLLDESSDNLSITGTWNGEFIKDSCGKIFRGTWKDTSSSALDNAPDVPFTLTRLP
jgi:hypothetical protein